MSSSLPELLCPAGDEAALRAAIDCGANAVYLGYKAFGARASAVNFDDEALERAVSYSHLYHARVHVTVNTLIKPSELSGVHQALSAIDAAGADAVIVQDQGVAAMVRRDFPRLQLHASTQMALCNAEGARMAQKLGFDRVVLARECSLEEIRRVCQTGIETEVFAHGALCTAVSGRCLMSSMAGGRSGNRGRCAQPCRQQFRLGGENGPLLSLRDLCTLDDLPALCDAGVASLKIEGRLKSAEYVAVVTSVYRRALDQMAAGHFDPAQAREQLMQVFNRGGFTRGHAFHAEDAALVTPDRVSHEGLPIGQIVSVRRDFATMRTLRDLHNGDSLQLRDQKDEDMRYSGPEIPAGELATLRLRPGLRVTPGTPVARLTDAQQMEQARAHAPAAIAVSLSAQFAIGQPMRLSISDGETCVTVLGETVQAAQKRVSTAEDARRQLEKLGGTPFVCKQADVQADSGVFLPVSALNALRRDAVERLIQARISAFAASRARRTVDFRITRTRRDGIGPDSLAVVFSDATLARPLLDAGATHAVFAPKTFTADALANELPMLSDRCWLRLPPQMTQVTLEAVLSVIEQNAGHLGGLWAESIAQLALLPELPMIAGEGIPVTNSGAVSVISQSGVSACSLWPEWSHADQKALEWMNLPRLVKLYGRETLMLLQHCPERVRLGLSASRADCRLCRTPQAVCGRENATLTDRKGYFFPLSRTRFAHGCEIQVLGALPTDLRAFDGDRRALGAGALLHFTIEAPGEQIALTRAFAALLGGENIPAANFPTTSGHWLRGVD